MIINKLFSPKQTGKGIILVTFIFEKLDNKSNQVAAASSKYLIMIFLAIDKVLPTQTL